ncbi:hypothetical protein BDZ89DRAFT_1139244 [Hymenopellis radicata]|nr:hypothetical protein BDZ89DRAFT_1139244 [Hymenopellis radicata]
MSSSASQKWTPTDTFRPYQPVRLAPKPKQRMKCIFPTFTVRVYVLVAISIGCMIAAPGHTYYATLTPLATALLVNLGLSGNSLPLDYADVTTGAKVVLGLTTPTNVAQDLSWLGRLARNLALAHDPDETKQRLAVEAVFRSRHETDGTCWEIEGTRGSIAVMLSDFTSPTAIAFYQPIQHQLSPHTGAMAPRHLTVWGLAAEGESARNATDELPVSHFLASGRAIPKDVTADQRLAKLVVIEFKRNSGLPQQVFSNPIVSHASHDVDRNK